ncbi:MAG: hypothetical protein EAZ55_09160 [Cytophagales bacterium]|nr:MAG: hypothetical protein EAZ55_09160 [Cytophagales bacterium]
MNLTLKKLSQKKLFFLFGFLWLSLSHGAAQHNAILQIPNLVGYYEFNNSLDNLATGNESNTAGLSQSLSFDKGLLRVNGSYNTYESEFYYHSPSLTYQEDITLSWTFKPDALREDRENQTLLSIDSYSRILNFVINRDKGFFTVEIKNSEYYQEYEETKIEVNKWYNITAVIKPTEKTAQIYLNGYALPPITLADFINSTKAKETFNFSFCSYGNGCVFSGWVDKLVVIKRALNPQEIKNFYPLMIKDVPEMLPNPITKTISAKSGTFSYTIDQEWTMLPSCVEGDKVKNITVACPSGRKITFNISHKEKENQYVILRNSFSSIGGYVFNNFDACLNQVLELGKADCAK